MRKLISLVLVLALVSSCSNGEGNTSDSPSISKKMSKVETCREIYRLIGKATDIMVSKNYQLPFDFSEVVQEFESLAKKNNDETLQSSIGIISESLTKMSSETSFFEGNSMYLGEITNLGFGCAPK
jgi:hypothetical protein